MTLHVVGGVYHERCIHPHWNEIYGSAGRAAIAIATLGTPVRLHSYMNEGALQIIAQQAAWLTDFCPVQTKIEGIVSFIYLHDMASPDIKGVPVSLHPPIVVTEDKVLRFGMLDGDAVVHANWAVYDPQNAHDGQPFAANGSTADHLALVLNSFEAECLAEMPGGHPSKTAPVLAECQKAEVVVIKMGPEGAFVWTSTETAQIPAFKTSRVWKIGSGDCFVAQFANAWMYDRKSPIEAATIASKATAYYCETKGFPTKANLEVLDFPPVVISPTYRQNIRQVYLAGPFFDLAQIWMVQQARINLMELGLKVFSPYHDIGLGLAQDVVLKDLEGIRQSDLVLALSDGLDAGTVYEIGYARALNKPVVVYSERHRGESLKMMEGSGCTICAEYTSAMYSTLWEAVKI
ncbi:MAG: PfkB family carbohydrate kinase [Parvibaculum sp.]|nr:PfkB family carbohydrate kinase [Parvibaculum sp.]